MSDKDSQEYDGIALAHDATEFAESRFGQHYLTRIEGFRQSYLAQTQNEGLSDSQRAHAGSRAAVVADEIAYFQTAKTITSDPSLIKRIRDNLEKKLKGEKSA